MDISKIFHNEGFIFTIIADLAIKVERFIWTSSRESSGSADSASISSVCSVLSSDKSDSFPIMDSESSFCPADTNYKVKGANE